MTLWTVSIVSHFPNTAFHKWICFYHWEPK